MNKNLESGELNNEKGTTAVDQSVSPSENNATSSQPSVETLTKGELIERLKNLRLQEEIPSRAEVDEIKHAYYNIRNAEKEEEKTKYEEINETSDDFVPSVDPSDDVVKEYLTKIKEKRAKKIAEEEALKEKNYKIKLEIIKEIIALTESTDNFNDLFNRFKEQQSKWNEIKLVPQNKQRELWDSYQAATEKFFDLVKINNELRDYDLKKNLELKTAICESAEKLITEDPVSAFHQLQNFHEEWKEIGPVEKDLREPLWQRFKEASTTINKNYQAHFESLKGQEEDNLVAKRAIIDVLKAIDFAKLESFKEWDKLTKEVIELQAKWKTIGFVPKKFNNEIFEEFRGLCDDFFEKKSVYFKSQKNDMEENLKLKRALVEKANELKDSKDWKRTTQELVKIQKDWKKIGSVPRKHSDAIWKEFVDACDHFFAEKKKIFSSQKEEEQENYKAKTAIVEKIKNLDTSLEANKIIEELKQLQDEWNKIGFVPFKDKDKSYKELYAAIDAHYDRLKINKSERRFEEFKSNIEDKIANNEKNADRILSKEREHLVYQYNKIKSDLNTYENNMSFLILSSKNQENSLLKDVNKKIDSLKNELTLIEKKMNELNELG